MKAAVALLVARSKSCGALWASTPLALGERLSAQRRRDRRNSLRAADSSHEATKSGRSASGLSRGHRLRAKGKAHGEPRKHRRVLRVVQVFFFEDLCS